MKRYKFVGNGAGVPGLPHEISQAEIEKMNVLELGEFNAAFQAGLYVEVTDPRPVRRSRKSETVTSPEQGA